MFKQILAEIAAILARPVTPLERLRIRSAANRGMVNPYDLIAALALR